MSEAIGLSHKNRGTEFYPSMMLTYLAQRPPLVSVIESYYKDSLSNDLCNHFIQVCSRVYKYNMADIDLRLLDLTLLVLGN